jgi:hypothetical protein
MSVSICDWWLVQVAEEDLVLPNRDAAFDSARIHSPLAGIYEKYLTEKLDRATELAGGCYTFVTPVTLSFSGCESTPSWCESIPSVCEST